MKVELMETIALQDIVAVIDEAVAAERAGQNDLAALAWKKVTRLAGDDPSVMVRIAEDLFAQKAALTSEALLGHVVAVFPSHLIAVLKWMERAFQRGDWPETLNRGELAREKFPDSSFGYVIAAQAFRESRRLDEADLMFGDAVERFQGDEGAMLQWGDCAIRRSDWDEAVRRFALARERFPYAAFGYTMGVQALRAAGLTGRAEDLLSEAIDRFEQEPRLYVEWIECASARRDWSEVVRRADIVRKRFPGQLYGVAQASQALAELGRTEDAQAIRGYMADQISDNPATLSDWTEQAIKARNWPEAQSRAALLLTRFPDHAGSYFLSARAFREDGKSGEAVAVLEEPLRRFPNEIALLWEASEAMVDLQRLDEALRLIDRALTLQPQDGGFLQRRIQLSMNLGDHAGAFAIWRRMVSDPAANRRLCLDIAWTIFKAAPADRDVLELVAYMLSEADTGARDWLPQLAGCVLLRGVRPELIAFVRESLPDLVADDNDPVTLELLRSALLIDYDEAQISRFLAKYVGGGRSAITAHLFSQTYIHEKPRMLPLFKAVFEDYIAQWLQTVTPLQFTNFSEILGYLNFAAVFSHSSYRCLVAACIQNLDIATLGTDWSLQTPASVLGHVVPLAARAQPPLPVPSVLGRIRRLKIAVCVSGQLRGYERAFPTWSRMGLQRHDTRYFINTWRDIGRNWYRFWSFTQRRELLWETLRRTDSFIQLGMRYPTMTAACAGSSVRDAEQLRAFYGTEFLCVEDDAQPPFNDKSVPWKMHSKIERAHEMACASGEEFDLYIRIRPDREVLEDAQPNWYDVYERSKRERMIFSDRSFEYGIRKCTFGDQFAVGCREIMDIYSSTFSATMAFLEKGEVPLDLPAALDNHGSMAYRTFYNGLLSSTVPDLQFGHLFDPVSLKPADLVPFIEHDVSGRTMDEFDREFLAACREMIR
jgi:tetratricopeptide (TPR) repeat protein